MNKNGLKWPSFIFNSIFLNFNIVLYKDNSVNYKKFQVPILIFVSATDLT